MTFLEITAEQRSQANDALAAAGVHHRVNPIEDNNGSLLLPPDLLSDLDGNFAAAKSVLEHLPSVTRSASDFPAGPA